MSPDPASPQAPRPGKRSFLTILMNAGVVCFFAVGVVVAASSFGLFGCWCTEGFVREKPPEKVWKGDMPPVPPTAK